MDTGESTRRKLQRSFRRNPGKMSEDPRIGLDGDSEISRIAPGHLGMSYNGESTNPVSLANI